jgi:hypothetical protein
MWVEHSERYICWLGFVGHEKERRAAAQVGTMYRATNHFRATKVSFLALSIQWSRVNNLSFLQVLVAGTCVAGPLLTVSKCATV